MIGYPHPARYYQIIRQYPLRQAGLSGNIRASRIIRQNIWYPDRKTIPSQALITSLLDCAVEAGLGHFQGQPHHQLHQHVEHNVLQVYVHKLIRKVPPHLEKLINQFWNRHATSDT